MTNGAPAASAHVSFGNGICQINGALNFVTAPAALREVVSHIHQHPELEIDFSGVSESNSVGLALMIEWLAEARRKKHSVTFSHIPNSLRQLAGVCQVDGLI